MEYGNWAGQRKKITKELIIFYLISLLLSLKPQILGRSQQAVSGWELDSFKGDYKPNKMEKGIKLSFHNLGSLGKANNTAKMQNNLMPAKSFRCDLKIQSGQKAPNITTIAKFQATEIFFFNVYIFFKVWNCHVHE